MDHSEHRKMILERDRMLEEAYARLREKDEILRQQAEIIAAQTSLLDTAMFQNKALREKIQRLRIHF